MPANHGSQSSQSSQRSSQGSQGSPGALNANIPNTGQTHVFATPTARRRPSCGVSSPVDQNSDLCSGSPQAQSLPQVSSLQTSGRITNAAASLVSTGGQANQPCRGALPHSGSSFIAITDKTGGAGVSGDSAMGYTRSGTPYSPSPKGNSRSRSATRTKSNLKRVDRSETEKRRMSLESAEQNSRKHSKENESESETMELSMPSGFSIQGAITADDFMAQMQKQMETMMQNSLGGIIQKSVEDILQNSVENAVQRSLEKTIKNSVETTINDAVQKAIDGIRDDLNKDSKKHSEGIEELKKGLAGQEGVVLGMEKRIDATSKALGVHKSSITEKLKTADLVFETAMKQNEEALQAITERLSSLEEANSNLNTKLSDVCAAVDINGTDAFPHYRSLMAYSVLLKGKMSPEDAASLIIHDALGLEDITIVRVLDMGKNEQGKNTLKILLSSGAECVRVLKKKNKLGQTNVEDIRNIWLQQSKTNEQRTMERNCGVILRNSELRKKFRQDRYGRIVPIQRDVSIGEGESRSALPSHSSFENLTESWDAGEDWSGPENNTAEQQATTQRWTTPRGHIRGVSRGRGRDRGRARGGRGQHSRSTAPGALLDPTHQAGGVNQCVENKMPLL